MERALTKMGEGGRLVIPAEYRKALGVKPGDELVLVLEENSLRVLTPHEGIRRAPVAGSSLCAGGGPAFR